MLGSVITYLKVGGWLILKEIEDFSLALVQNLVLKASYFLGVVQLCKLKKKHHIVTAVSAAVFVL